MFEGGFVRPDGTGVIDEAGGFLGHGHEKSRDPRDREDRLCGHRNTKMGRGQEDEVVGSVGRTGKVERWGNREDVGRVVGWRHAWEGRTEHKWLTLEFPLPSHFQPRSARDPEGWSAT